MAKLFDQPVKDAHIIIESADDGNLDLRLSYPLTKIEAPLRALIFKATAKVPFLQRTLDGALGALFVRFGVKSSAPVAEAASTEEGSTHVADSEPVAAHAAEPIEAVHQA